MTKIKLHDLFIGDYPISQKFGANYNTYKWIKDINGKSIKGHNGVDWGYKGKNGIQLLNPFPKGNDVMVSKVSFDKPGFGWYLRMWDKTQGFVVLFAHGQEVVVREWQKLQYQQLVAYGNNTGWSTGPHLHAGGYFVDKKGNRLNRNNGFDGYVNLLDKNIIKWEIKNPKKPAEIDTSTDDTSPLSVCLIDRKKFWKERDEARNEIKELNKTIKQAGTESAKLKLNLKKVDKYTQTLIANNIKKDVIIKQMAETVQQNTENAKQDKENAVKTAIELTTMALKKYDYRSLSAGTLISYGILKLLGKDLLEVKKNGH